MTWQLYQGDCLEVLKQYPDNYFDSVVTDPPYELGFMGKKWDSTGIAYNIELWQEVLRVLKPGGHLLAFGGTRTYHRMACAIEDAGFEIRDCIQWLYGSGFPKSLDISKAIDKQAGAERKVIGKSSRHGGGIKGNGTSYELPPDIPYITAPATEEAKQWDGWGTALKPANEPIVLARKPISEKTIAENVMKWGTGGLNIDGCRIGEGGDYTVHHGGSSGTGIYQWNKGEQVDSSTDYYKTEGRFPANVILDEEAGKLLDEQSGISKSTGGSGEKSRGALGKNVYGKYSLNIKASNAGGLGDSGGASRFFYCAKASKKERGDSKHPTVKPLSLMRYLCRLITPPGGIVLDPFAGSGTTLEAAILEGFNVVGIEKEHDYIPDIRRRIERAQLNTQAMDMGLFLIELNPDYCDIIRRRMAGLEANLFLAK